MSPVLRTADLGVTVEYLNPFLVSKPNADTGSLQHLKTSGATHAATITYARHWLDFSYNRSVENLDHYRLEKCILLDLPIQTIHVYCGTITPYKGIRVYTRCAMGMPDLETALEEHMCRVLGDHIQAGFVSKLADDLYCSGNSPDELLENWTKVLNALHTCNLRLSASKTIVCPRSTT